MEEIENAASVEEEVYHSGHSAGFIDFALERLCCCATSGAGPFGLQSGMGEVYRVMGIVGRSNDLGSIGRGSGTGSEADRDRERRVAAVRESALRHLCRSVGGGRVGGLDSE